MMANTAQRHGGGYAPYNDPSNTAQRHGGGYAPYNDPSDKPSANVEGTGAVSRANNSVLVLPALISRPSETESTTDSDPNMEGGITFVNERAKGESSAMLSDVEKGVIAHEFSAVSHKNAINKIPRTHLSGYFNVFRFDGRTSSTSFFIYQKAAQPYKADRKHRHRDTMHRVTFSTMKDKFPSPVDGKAKGLIVQCADDIYKRTTSEGTWDRTFIRNMAPFHLRLALWGTNHIHYTRDPTIWQHVISWLKYIPTCLLLVFVISFPGNADGEVRNGGRYDSFPYRFWGYAKAARNPIEQAKVHKAVGEAQAADGNVGALTERTLLPRRLCIPDPHGDGRLFVVMTTEQYLDHFQARGGPRYLFVSYTTKQFSNSDQHSKMLHDLAIRATKDAGLDAYWISCSCMDTDTAGLEKDVFLISDVLRAASAVALVVQQSQDTPEINTMEGMLRQAGDRLWTFPEILLSPAHKPIRVYRSSQPDYIPYEKNQIAAFAWSDSSVSRQLVDHYEGTLSLSRLELVSMALSCLAPRKTSKYLDGDVSYALMGLMRLRPVVDKTDSEFQAFARLSLANDSDCLLERLMCVLPKVEDQSWHCMDDAYGVKLWDIYPSVQIAGVGEDDTVIIDNARAASVRWKSFAPVHSVRRFSWTRCILKIALHSSVLLLIIGILCIWSSVNVKALEAKYSFGKRSAEPGIWSWIGSITDGTTTSFLGTTTPTTTLHTQDLTSETTVESSSAQATAMSSSGSKINLLNDRGILDDIESGWSDLTGDVASIETQVAAIPDIANLVDELDQSYLPSLASKFASFESQVTAMPQITSMIGDLFDSYLPSLTSKLASFESQITTMPQITSMIGELADAYQEVVPDLASKFESLESQITAMPEITGLLDEYQGVVPSLTSKLASLESQLTAVPKIASIFSAYQEQITALPDITQKVNVLKPVVETVVNTSALMAWGVIFVIWSVLLLAAAPKLLRVLYGGKFWNTQPWIFGFEGYMDIETIEAQIFGTCKGRLRWSAFGSPLSQHKVDEYGHCEPVDPTTSPEVRRLVKKAKTSKVGQQKVFTIVDTNTMTVTLFQAARAPVAFLLLGAEGGMQRAVGCSYDWTTETLHRETVLRMETSVLDKMDIIPRVNLSIQRLDQAWGDDGVRFNQTVDNK